MTDKDPVHPIPDGVYFHFGNFYNVDGTSRPTAFLNRWWDRRAEFPKKEGEPAMDPADPKELQNDDKPIEAAAAPPIMPMVTYTAADDSKSAHRLLTAWLLRELGAVATSVADVAKKRDDPALIVELRHAVDRIERAQIAGRD